MIDLDQQGVIGRYADEGLSNVGTISMFEELATDLATHLVNECLRQRVGLLLILPFCPLCPVAAGVSASRTGRWAT